MPIGTKPFSDLPPPQALVPPDVAFGGAAIPAIERLRYMSSATWEDFIHEWVYSLKDKYARVEHCGGGGDMGRDVVAFQSESEEIPWDNFQCKHYQKRLTPSDIWIEIAKLAYYTLTGEYCLPRQYIFVAPHGAGNALSKLLRRPDELRKGLLNAWEKYCQDHITSTSPIYLDSDLVNHINNMNFSIFSAASPLRVIEEHKLTAWHVPRFGGGLPLRSDAPHPPNTIEERDIVKCCGWR